MVVANNVRIREPKEEEEEMNVVGVQELGGTTVGINKGPCVRFWFAGLGQLS